MAKITVKVIKRVITGRFVSKGQLKRSPKTTYVQSVKKSN